MIEVREIAQAPAPLGAPPGVLEVEQDGPALADQDVAVVKVSVHESCPVKLGDARPEQRKQAAALLERRVERVF